MVMATPCTRSVTLHRTRACIAGIGLLLLASTGCGGGNGNGSTGGAGGSGGAGGGGTGGAGGVGTGGSGAGIAGSGSGGTATGSPVILNLSTNITVMTPNDNLIVTAVVTHPQGIAQVVGGTLSDPGGGTYGAFQVSTVSGSYSLTLTWGAINLVRTIGPDKGGTTRMFQAQFYDQAGHSTSQDVSVILKCGSASSAWCGTACQDLDSSRDDCGACGHVCTADGGGSPMCTAGQCTVMGPPQ